MSKTYTSEIKNLALTLVFDKGLSSQEAASQTGTSYSTVRRWVRAANFAAITNRNQYIMKQLECRLEKAIEEREVLKRATIILAKDLSKIY